MTDIEENTPTENVLLEVADALSVAGAPRTDTERDGIGINIELDLHARVRWLANDRDDKAKEAATLKTKLDEVTKERDWIKKSRDAEYVEFKVKLGELTMKIEQLEVRKFATTADLVRVQQKADVVVDLVSGSVVKNRFGKRSGAKSKAKRLSAKPKPRKP